VWFRRLTRAGGWLILTPTILASLCNLWTSFSYLYATHQPCATPTSLDSCWSNWRPSLPLPIDIPLFLTLLISALGAGFGQRRLRTTLLAALTVLAGLMIWLNVAFFLDQQYADIRPTTVGGWFSLTPSKWFVAWAALNFWYFLGPPSSTFYPKA
jgi:hypothetical protein